MDEKIKLLNIKFHELLIEMKWEVVKQHAKIVYDKCVSANKLMLAAKIAHKYGIEDHRTNDDTLTAFALAAIASKTCKHCGGSPLVVTGIYRFCPYCEKYS